MKAVPEITVLCCGRTLEPGFYPREGWAEDGGRRVRFIRISCGVAIEPRHLVRLFENGADGILVVTCAREACQSLFGTSCAAGRIRYTQGLLEEVGLGAGRLLLVAGDGLTAAGLAALTAEAAAAFARLGPSPVKSPAGAR
ncbi:MAG: hydrogenase iron-sulfur subunit [Chloroflexi bacterium]|nr:hydrogenase iron-sulfur subunit [Chloroflexota bacterium]